MAIFYGRADSERRLLKKYPKEVKGLQDIPRVYEQVREKLKEKDTGFFAFIKHWNKKRQLNKFKKNRDDPLHAGAKGESMVMDKLSTLSDNYMFCAAYILDYPTPSGTTGKRT